MKKWLVGVLIGVVIVIMLLPGCTPQVVPAPAAAPSPSGAPASPAPVPKTSPVVTPEQAAWDKVVEAAKKEGKVTAYSYTWVGDIGLAVERAFESKYGIDMEIITGSGAQFHERVKTEKRMGRMVADMTEGSALLINNMKVEGLLVSVAEDIPVLRDKEAWWVDPLAFDPVDKANLWWRQNIYTPYINTRLVKPEDVPKFWKDILNPKWKGKMTLSDPNIASGPYQLMVVLMEHKIWDEEFIKALYKQDLRFPRGLPEEFRMLAMGESHLAIRGSDATAARFVMEGAPIQAIEVKDGAIASAATIAAIAGGPHPSATRVLFNWIFSTEGQTVAGKAQGNRMVRKDVPDFRPDGVKIAASSFLVEKREHLEKSTQLFRDKWFDKLVGR